MLVVQRRKKEIEGRVSGCACRHPYLRLSLSETHLHQGIGDDLFEIQGFHDIICNDRNAHGGGVAIYVKSNIISKHQAEFGQYIFQEVNMRLM